MNADVLKGQWNELKGKAKARWGALTDDELQQIDGNFEELVGAIQKGYGKSREAAEQEIQEWSPDASNRE